MTEREASRAVGIPVADELRFVLKIRVVEYVSVAVFVPALNFDFV
ncbi:MAG: hypothetical protein ABIP88_05955 [Candidatus Binatia bacterium]